MTLEALYRAARGHGLTSSEAARLVRSTVRRRAYRIRHGGKVCGECHETKPVRAFGVDSRERDGLRRVCRECRTVEAPAGDLVPALLSPGRATHRRPDESWAEATNRLANDR